MVIAAALKEEGRGVKVIPFGYEHQNKCINLQMKIINWDAQAFVKVTATDKGVAIDGHGCRSTSKKSTSS